MSGSIWWNLAALLAGHVTAVGYFRSGRPWVGFFLVAGLWLAVDGALVMRFGFGRPESEWGWALVAMQVLACVATARFAFLRLRRKGRRHLAMRERSFRDGLTAFIRDDLASARRVFGRIAARDPWDEDAREAFSMVRNATPLRAGKPGRAARARPG
jgi:hypothetical protein